MTSTSHFLSCDWGTTSFRLRWVAPPAGIAHEIHETVGVKAIYERALRENSAGETARGRFFAEYLGTRLEELRARAPDQQMAPPLVISGMASSSVGWKELPYAAAPFPLDGTTLAFEELQWDAPPWLGPTYLLSGIATGEDMMRGEETEILGILNDDACRAFRDGALLILPGTHSKHVRVERGQIVDFRTFMTGELFAVLGRHSLLAASVNVDGNSSPALSSARRRAFAEGVQRARNAGLAAGLFRVRTRAVLDKYSSEENTSFLSGLLIGAELEHVARQRITHPVVIAASGTHAELYRAASECLGLAAHVLPPQWTQEAIVRAHALFLAARRSGQ